MKTIILLFLLACQAQAQNLTVAGPFSGLNSADSSITIAEGEAQDTLNVEVSADALALKKRKGYTLNSTLTTTTEPVKGSVIFKTSAGDTIKLFAHDTYVSKSVNGGTYTALITSATYGSKWDFCVAAGKAYAFNTSHDIPFSYDGSSVTYYASMPRASLCAMTVDRMLLAGTTDQPNRLYFSRSGTLTDFVAGTDPEDPGFEDLGLAGEKITNIFTTQAEWLIFKTNSFTSIQGTNQFDLVPSVISERVGMIDTYAITESEGVVYFKASDGRMWGYTSGTLSELSKKIDPFVDMITKDAVNSAEYTTKAQFDSGTYYNSTGSITAGSIDPYQYIVVDDEDSDFDGDAGSTTITNDAIYFKNYTGKFPNMGAESDSNPSAYWEDFGSPSLFERTSSGATWGGYRWRKALGCSAAPAWFFFTGPTLSAGSVLATGPGNSNFSVNTSNFSSPFYLAFSCVVPLSEGYSVRSFFPINPGGTITGNTSYTGSTLYWDIDENGVVPTSATYISSVKTITAPEPHFGYITFTSSNPKTGTIIPSSTITISVSLSSSPTGVFSNWQEVQNGLALYTTGYAYKYRVDFQRIYGTLEPYVTNVQLLFKSTGYWETPEVSMGGMNSWGIFNADTTTDGLASWNYAIYTSTYAGGTAVAAPEALTDGAVITSSTGTYSKIRATNSFYAATETVRLDNLSYSWSRTPYKMANAFEYKGDIYFSVPYNNSLSNNRLLKFDTKTAGWNIFDIPLNSPIVDDYVYFGSPIGGYVYQYPYGDNDNGAAINSYWKSKNYVGANPYVEKQFQRMSVIAGSDFGSTLDVTYMMDTSTSTSYTISLTSSTADFVRNNRALPVGEIGTFFNLQIGNNAANQPWSFFGASVGYSEEPWRVLPEE